MTANLPYSPPVNTDIDYCRTFFIFVSVAKSHYRFEIRQNSVKSTVRSEIDHFRCKIGSGW